jgi:uncharacterized protein (TIGR02265 family)
VSEAFWEELAHRGFDRFGPFQPEYPASVWKLVLEAGLPHVPSRDRDDALRLLGVRAIEGFQHTMVGAALFQFLKLIGLERGLNRVTRSFRNGNNFLELELLTFEAGRATLRAQNVMGVPEHFLGMLIAGSGAVGARDIDGRVVTLEGDVCTYELRWSRLDD